MEIQVRLAFKDIFTEETKDIVEYLKQISKSNIDRIIGFLASNDVEVENWFTNLNMVIKSKIDSYIRGNPHIKFSLLSSETKLHLAEIILENREFFLNENPNDEDIDRDEINLFKAILLINESLNDYDIIISNSDKKNIEKAIDMMIAIKFSSYDLGMYDDMGFEILKLSVATIYKFKSLISFLQSEKKYNFILEELCKSFGQNSVEELINRVKFLVLKTNVIVREKDFVQFKISNNDTEIKNFFDSLCAENVIVDNDFLYLRNKPIYQLKDGTYAIINLFFVLDKFTNSIRFFIGKINNIEAKHLEIVKRLKNNTFYSEDFSEKYLMKNLLDEIFYKKYFIKKKEIDGSNNEPDYYIRYNKDIFLFEYKDAYIDKNTKVSRDVTQIESELKNKFFETPKGKAKGIKQLLKHIELINKDEFKYDDNLDIDKHSHTIYPILLLSHRLLEVPGINYIMNEWFKEELKNMNLKKGIIVKDLIVIDIDTLIYYKEYYRKKDRYFKDTLDEHIKKSNANYKGYGISENAIYNTSINKLEKKILPYSYRMGRDVFADTQIRQNADEFIKKLFTE